MYSSNNNNNDDDNNNNDKNNTITTINKKQSFCFIRNVDNCAQYYILLLVWKPNEIMKIDRKFIMVRTIVFYIWKPEGIML